MSTENLWKALETAFEHPNADGDTCRAAIAELEALERQAKTDVRDRALKARARLVQNQPSAALAVLESVLFSDAMPSDEKLDELGAGDVARANATWRNAAWNAAIEAAEKIASAAAEDAERRREQAKTRDSREGYIVAEGQWDVLAPVAEDIRALRREAK